MKKFYFQKLNYFITHGQSKQIGWADDSSMRLDSFLASRVWHRGRSSADIIRSGRVHVNETKSPNRVQGHGCWQGASWFEGSSLQKNICWCWTSRLVIIRTASDPHADKLVIDSGEYSRVRLYTAGRLDRDSEGLIILTNDGDYAAKLTHPKHGNSEEVWDHHGQAVVLCRYSENETRHNQRRWKHKGNDVKALKGLDYVFIMGEGKSGKSGVLWTVQGKNKPPKA